MSKMTAKIIKTTDGNIRHIKITLGDDTYTITKSIDDKLNINKTGDINDEMAVFARYSNEIEIK